MHRHIEWDEPGADSVMYHFKEDATGYADPGPGDILSGRYQGLVVRIKVEAYVNGTSIGSVVALIDPHSGTRRKLAGDLVLGDTVRLPDESRAFEPRPNDDEQDEK